MLPKHDIALVIADMGPGGAQRVASLLSESWIGMGERVALITLSDPSSDFFLPDERVTRVSLGGATGSPTLIHGLFANVRRVARLRSVLRELSPRAVVSFVGATNILAIFAARGLPARVVISERNDPRVQSLGRIWDRMRRSTYRYADLVTANSRNAIDGLEAFVPPSKLALVDNPVEGASEDGPSETHEVLAVGRLVHQKAFDVLVSAMPLVIERVPDATVTVIGEGPLRQTLQSHAASLSVGDRFSWVGLKRDLSAYRRRARIFALPSRHEGTPNALLEAMACGLACVVSDSSGGALDLIEDEVSGLIVPVDDPAALASALTRLLSDKEMAIRLGVEARKRVAHLSPTVVARRWLALLEA